MYYYYIKKQYINCKNVFDHTRFFNIDTHTNKNIYFNYNSYILDVKSLFIKYLFKDKVAVLHMHCIIIEIM